VQEYTVSINGIEHTMRLSADDAKRLGARSNVEVKKAAPADKAKTPANKSASSKAKS
jgi:hypothetical protein